MSKGVHGTFSYLFDVGKDVLFAAIDAATKTILCQLGDSTKQVPDSDQAEIWGPPGLWSLPAPPTQGGSSCQALTIKHSDRDIIFATRDLRRSSIYGNLKSGETCVGANIGQARTIYKADGTITDVTTSDNTPGGTTISQTVGPEGYTLSTPWGGITINSQGITITAGQAALMLTASGDAKLIGQTATVHGSVAALVGDVITTVGPKPAAPATPCLYGPTALAGLPSSNVFISV